MIKGTGRVEGLIQIVTFAVGSLFDNVDCVAVLFDVGSNGESELRGRVVSVRVREVPGNQKTVTE